MSVNPENNWLLMLGLLGLALALVYFVLPRLFKKYETEKGIKLVLVYFVLGYLAYDFYLKEKYIYLPFFIGGAVLYTYLIWIAKRK